MLFLWILIRWRVIYSNHPDYTAFVQTYRAAYDENLKELDYELI